MIDIVFVISIFTLKNIVLLACCLSVSQRFQEFSAKKFRARHLYERFFQ